MIFIKLTDPDGPIIFNVKDIRAIYVDRGKTQIDMGNLFVKTDSGRVLRTMTVNEKVEQIAAMLKQLPQPKETDPVEDERFVLLISQD